MQDWVAREQDVGKVSPSRSHGAGSSSPASFFVFVFFSFRNTASFLTTSLPPTKAGSLLNMSAAYSERRLLEKLKRRYRAQL